MAGMSTRALLDYAQSLGLLNTQPYKDYLEKEIILEQDFSSVDPHDFYYELFDEGKDLQSRDASNDGKANVIVLFKNLKTNTMKRRTLHAENKFSDLDKIPHEDFAFLAPISYFGKANNLKNARFMYAMAIDLDGVDGKRLEDGLLYQIQNEIIPRPTYIVNSGNGIHLYYKFLNPVPMRPGLQVYLRDLKRDLVDLIWSMYTSKIEARQYQSINQGFRLVGSLTKALINQVDIENDKFLTMQCTVNAYRSGEPVTLKYLEEFSSASIDEAELQKNGLSLQEAKEKYPEWYQHRIINKEPPGQWAINRAMYDWWIRKIKGEVVDERGKKIGMASFGHRYWCIYTLAVLAVKCGKYDEKKNPNPVTKKELKKDAKELLPFLNKLSKEPFTEGDKNDALRIYDDPALAIRLSTRFLKDQTAIPMPPSHPHKPKGEGQPREWHLEDMRARKELMKKRGQPFKNPEGRPPLYKKRVKEWRKEHPEGKKIECARDLGISRPTVDKWWD